jgi:hypothetical protein
MFMKYYRLLINRDFYNMEKISVKYGEITSWLKPFRLS